MASNSIQYYEYQHYTNTKLHLNSQLINRLLSELVSY